MKKVYSFLAVATLVATTSTAQQLDNSSLEMWQTINAYEDPEHWGTLNSLSEYYTNAGAPCNYSVTKTSDAQEGNFAAKIETISNQGQAIAFGALFTSNLYNVLGTQTAGVPYNLKPDSLVGYYKYETNDGDAMEMRILLSKWNTSTNTSDTLVWNIYSKSAASGYTRFSVPFVYQNNALVPDTLAIIFINTLNSAAPPIGNVLYIDNIGLVFNNVGIISKEFESFEFYPNPASSHVTVNNHEMGLIRIYDATGILIETIEKNGIEPLDVNTENYTNGMYFFHFNDRTAKVMINN